MSSSILIVRFGSLGDVILTSATVMNLRLNYPNHKIVYLTKEGYRSVVEMMDTVDEIVTLPESASSRDFLRLLLWLDKGNFDLIVDLHGNYRSWLARKFITASEKVIYPKARIGRWLSVRRKSLPRTWTHTIDRYNGCLEPLGQTVYCHRPVLQSHVHLEESSVRPRRTNSVVIAPGAAHPNKQWPLQRFAESARLIHEGAGSSITWVVTGSQAKEELPPRGSIPEDALTVRTDVPVPELAEIISSARLTLSNDSGIGHLSSAVSTPTLAVFGPTHECLGFSPRGLFDRVVGADEYCRPCSLHGKKRCYRESRFCFDRVTPEIVAQTAVELLASRANTGRALFIDRDGTLIEEKDYLSDPDGVRLIDGAVGALKKTVKLGLKIIILTNQSGVARGYFGIDDVDRVNGRVLELLAKEGLEVDGVYFSPYHPRGVVAEYTRHANSRKPAAGMAEDAASQLGIDLRRSYMVGDSMSDVNLARVFGGGPILVRTGFGHESEKLLKTQYNAEGVRVADDLAGAVAMIERDLTAGPV
jgi:histidinol-phosphate phosphatase family protein